MNGTEAKSFLCVATSVTARQKNTSPAIPADVASMAPAGMSERLSGQGMPDAGRFSDEMDMDAAAGSFRMPGKRRVASGTAPEG